MSPSEYVEKNESFYKNQFQHWMNKVSLFFEWGKRERERGRGRFPSFTHPLSFRSKEQI
jgi:hypothetical protein